MTKAPYETDICVNGRVPAIEDPNTGVVIWESGAIVEYLVDQCVCHRTFKSRDSP